MLSQVKLDVNFFKYLIETKGESSFGMIISRLLLHLKGAITKFVLYIDESCYSIDVEDIRHWILFLSTRGIKDLTIKNVRVTKAKSIKVPAHLFSCLELRHLKLVFCCFDPPTSFHGFPNLLSLELLAIQFESQKIGEFFIRCPVLENLDMSFTLTKWKVKLADFAKLSNLKILSLFLCNLDIASSSSIFEFVGFLPKLQELRLDVIHCKLTEGGAEKRFPTTFPSLKDLHLSTIDLHNDITLSCVVEMIRSFSNMQTLKISRSKQDTSPTQKICFPELDYNTKGLLQLRSVVFKFFKALEVEEWLIKHLLVCSPFLKKIAIHPHPDLAPIEQLRFAKKLVKLQQTYPAVDMDLY